MTEFKRISNRLLYRWKFWFWVERKVSVKLQRIDREIGAIKLHNAKIFSDNEISYPPKK